MAQIKKGETFTDVSPGKSVTSTRLNNHVDAAVLLPGAITEQTTVGTAIAADDTFIIHDQSASGLKKVEAQSILPPEAITGKTDISTAIAAADLFLVADASASNALLKVQAQNLLPPEAITGKTDLSATVALDDILLVSDTSASAALKRSTVAGLFTPMFFTSSAVGLNGLAAGKNIDEAHGLGSLPRLVYGVLVCTSTDNGYAAGDEIELRAAMKLNTDSAVNTHRDADFHVGASATNVFCVQTSAASGLYVRHKTTGAIGDLDETKWSLKLYAHK